MPTDRPNRPDHPDEEAGVRERADGAHAEEVTGASNLRADPTPPGVDPDDEEAASDD